MKSSHSYCTQSHYDFKWNHKWKNHSKRFRKSSQYIKCIFVFSLYIQLKHSHKFCCSLFTEEEKVAKRIQHLPKMTCLVSAEDWQRFRLTERFLAISVYDRLWSFHIWYGVLDNLLNYICFLNLIFKLKVI